MRCISVGLFEEDTCDRSGRKYDNFTRNKWNITSFCATCVLYYFLYVLRLKFQLWNVNVMYISSAITMKSWKCVPINSVCLSPCNNSRTTGWLWHMKSDTRQFNQWVICQYISFCWHWHTLYMKTCVCFFMHLKCNLLNIYWIKKYFKLELA